MGIDLLPDQASCAETTGYAMSLSPLWEPGIDEPIQLTTKGGICQVKPQAIEVILNEDRVEQQGYMTVKYNLQDQLDARHDGEAWRQYAQVVSKEREDEDCCWDMYVEGEEPTNRFLWDAVMIDQDQYIRLMSGVSAAIGNTHLPLWDHMGFILNNGLECDEDKHDHGCCSWSHLAEEFGISTATDEHGFPIETPEWVDDLCIPDWNAYLDPDVLRIWDRLCKTSKRNWQAFESATNVSTKPPHYGMYYRTRLDQNLWR